MKSLMWFAALAAVSMGGAAWADECSELAHQLVANRAAVDSAIGDPKHPPADVRVLLAQTEATSQKLHGHCPDKADTSEHSAWVNQEGEKQAAAEICEAIRKTGSDGGYERPEAGEVPAPDDAELDAASCMKELAPFGDTLNPHLKECQVLCARMFATHVKRTPECVSAIEKASQVLKEMEAFVEQAKSGKSRDAVIDYHVLSEKYHTVGTRMACRGDELPELKIRLSRLDAEVRIVGDWDTAKQDFEKYGSNPHEKSRPYASSAACIDELVRIPGRDAKLEKILAACRSMHDRTSPPPPVGVKTTRGGVTVKPR